MRRFLNPIKLKKLKKKAKQNEKKIKKIYLKQKYTFQKVVKK